MLKVNMNSPFTIAAVIVLTSAMTIAGVYLVRDIQPAKVMPATSAQIADKAQKDADKAVEAMNDAAISARKAADATAETSEKAKDTNVAAEKSAADTAQSAADAAKALQQPQILKK